MCVNDLKIPPSEVWYLDMLEITHLSNMKQSNIDTSLMLNFERKQNGASQEWLQKNL